MDFHLVTSVEIPNSICSYVEWMHWMNRNMNILPLKYNFNGKNVIISSNMNRGLILWSRPSQCNAKVNWLRVKSHNGNECAFVISILRNDVQRPSIRSIFLWHNLCSIDVNRQANEWWDLFNLWSWIRPSIASMNPLWLSIDETLTHVANKIDIGNESQMHVLHRTILRRPLYSYPPQ